MEGNHTSRLGRLLGRLRKEMNGSVSEAMERGGVHYPLNYGVSVPTIRTIAEPYGTDHDFAQFLYRQQVRELQLSAVFIDDPNRVTPAQMRLWSEQFLNTEIVEQCVTWLFAQVPCAVPVCLEWTEDARPLVRYAGLMLGARVIRPERALPQQAHDMLRAVEQATGREDMNSTLAHGTICALRQCASYSETLHREVRQLLSALESSGVPRLMHIAEETNWQIEA